MLRGLRVSDTAVLQRICAQDMKLFLRVGALLQAKLAFTEVALEGLVAGEAGRRLLTDRRLRDAVPDQFAALVQEAGCADLDLVLIDDSGDAEAGWRVVAIADELGNPLTAAAQAEASAGEAGSPLQGLSGMVSSLAPALRVPVEGLLQARADDERAAALEQLRYAAPPLPLVSELMPLILTDGAELVRERGIGLLVAAGAHTTVVDLIRALVRRDDQALARFSEPIGRMAEAQQDLVVAAVIAALSRGVASQSLVDLCRHLAPHLASHRALPRLLDLLLPARLSLLDLVRTLQAHDAPRVNALLVAQLGLSVERDAQLVVLLAAPGATPDDLPDREPLIERGIELLLTSAEQPPERMALAAALRRLVPGEALADRLAARAKDLGHAYDTSAYWLIAELCRDGAVSPPAADLLADAVRRLLREAPGPHLVAILEQQLPSLLPASPERRRQMVEPMVETIGRFIDERSRDLVAAAMAGIGTVAIGPLWTLLEEHPHATVRLLAAELLPDLLRDAPADEVRAAVTRLLKGLERAGQARERASLTTAAARLSGAPALAGDHAPARRVDAATQGLAQWGIDALGWLAAGEHLEPERRAAVIADMLDQLVEEVLDASVETTTDAATTEVTFVLDERLGHHTENVPRVLAALARIATSPSLPRDQLRAVVARLCLQWRRVSDWKVIWGPGNIQELGRTLGALAEHGDFPGPLRLQVCEALLPRIAQLGVARSLARVFTRADGSYLSRLAGTAATRLIELAAEGYYADDEHEELVEALVDYLAVPHLGVDGGAVRRRIIHILGVHKARLTARARAKLRFIATELDEDLRAKLDWAG